MTDKEIREYFKARLTVARGKLGRVRSVKRNVKLRLQIEDLKRCTKRQKCLWCGKLFQPRTLNHRCCKPRCSVRYAKKLGRE